MDIMLIVVCILSVIAVLIFCFVMYLLISNDQFKLEQDLLAVNLELISLKYEMLTIELKIKQYEKQMKGTKQLNVDEEPKHAKTKKLAK